MLNWGETIRLHVRIWGKGEGQISVVRFRIQNFYLETIKFEITEMFQFDFFFPLLFS